MPAPVFELFPDPPIEEVAPGGYTPLILHADENSARAFVKNFILIHLSEVSTEVDETLVDYVNAFDPSEVAAQVEAVLFEGYVEKGRDFIRKTFCTALSKVSKEADARFVDSVNAPDPCKIATEVEAVLFKHWGFNDTSKPVGQKYRVLVGAMVLPGIKDLRRALLLGEITPEELTNMSTLELHEKYPRRMFI